MGLTERVTEIRNSAVAQGKSPLPHQLQGVSKEQIAVVLRALDLESLDLIDVVFSLLDDVHGNWFAKAPKQAKFFTGASTAHIACHVGILQRGKGKLDREGRDYWIKPLRELGAIDPVYLKSKTDGFVPGHPVAKSSNSAYRLSPDFVKILKEPAITRRAMLDVWIRADRVRERRDFQAKLAEESRKAIDTKHSSLIEACHMHYAKHFLPGYEVLYIDDGDGDRITEEDRIRFQNAGIDLLLSDAMPDILLWNPTTDALWVIEAVTSDGEVDLHKVAQLSRLATRSGKSNIGFTTAYTDWKTAASRQSKHKNIAPDSYIWIQADPAKHLHVQAFN